MPEITKDPYAILKLPPGSSSADIRKQYHRLARIYHPDRNPSDKEWCEEQLKDLNSAFEILSNPSKKAALDASFSPRADKSTSDAIERPKPTQNSWAQAAESTESSQVANERYTGSSTTPQPAHAPAAPRHVRRRSAVPAVVAVCGVAIAISCIVFANRPSKTPTPAKNTAASHSHRAHSIAGLRPPAGISAKRIASKALLHHKTVNTHKVISARPRAEARRVIHKAVVKHVNQVAKATHRKPSTPREVHGAQATAIALRLAEQAEARGRAVYARKLNRQGISPSGMNLSQMRRAADRSQ